MSDKQYRVNEVFYSLQGEGVRAGTANVFIRFSGCNMQCSLEPGPKSPGGFDCDTEFVSGTHVSKERLHEWVQKRAPGWDQWLILTGGEPALQLDSELLSYLKEHYYRIAIETNGSVDVMPFMRKNELDWISLSPKVAEHAIRQTWANEIRYVRGYGQTIPKPVAESIHKLISPAFNGLHVDDETFNWCVNLVKENPEWRLSPQMHKLWRVP